MNTTLPLHQPVYEFHVAKKIRDKYELDESFFSLSGHVLFANFYQVRLFVQKINEKRPVSEHVSPGEINGAGLLDEIYHIAIRNYIKNSFPNAFTSALSNIEQKLGAGNFDNLLLEFVKVFPPKQVYKNELSAQQYIEGYTDSIANREIVLEELILLHFANRNPAFNKIKELFDENYLEGKKVYKNTISTLRQFFRKDEYKIGIGNTDLFDFLSMPFQKYSSSIWDQLEFIKNEWGIFIDHKLLQKIQSSKDLFTETINFEPNFDGGGGAPTIVPQYKGKKIDAEHLVIGKSSFKYAEDSTQEYDEPEQFTPDTNWMPNLILIAKNTYVWLDQLSKKYGREIKRLDQIPVDELEILKKWNINGLWLIGVWERSSASKKIKHLMGNIDAVSSAYSLYDYQIANDLGGEEAYHFFNELAKEHGIRLASDMVPNHTGIYSDWVLNHPDYYIYLDHPPFPNYTFNGENLSDNPDIELRIEDQYWEMKDAAVVFERKDNRTGEKRYYYHGNDGTNMPWNDTAQLNLMKEEVREALIQKIFDVARKFSVIRFDAAMTLAKKHYARLWFPEPGKGGDIPSRADYALTRFQFDELFPKEFWREVVDRINNEMPETLLLAEAFWLMEGYFVRTLGMHRVYNSAFMNMMMNEENEKYRELITNTLEFEPEILKRYVNFMSNPDEETAIEQFGNGDKYFGVLILMNTLPGLPMFAHGQIEGFTEKYGMEYQRAYYDEKPADWLVERHEREVFPILKKRYIFSEVSNFWIYDFIQKNGNLNENVFAYSNQYGIERGLVLYNNSYQATSGTFYFSRQKLNGNSSDESKLHNTNIAANLDIKSSDFHFYILRDATNGLEYFYNGKELHSSGLYVNLSGYEYRVFLHIEEIFDPSGQAYKFYKSNIGKGNYNVKREVEKLKLASLHDSFVNLFSKSTMTKYFKLQTGEKLKKEELVNLKSQLQSHINKLLDEISDRAIITYDYESLQPKFIKNFTRQLKLVNLLKVIFKKSKIKGDKDIHLLFNKYYKKTEIIILLYNTVLQLKEVFKDEDLINNYISEFMLTKPIKTVLSDHTEKSEELGPQLLLMNILLRVEDKYNLMDEIPLEFLKLRSPKKMYEHILNKNKFFLTQLTHDELIASYLDVNTYEGETYFAKERWDELLDLFTIHSILKYHNLLCKTFDKDIIRNRELVKIVRKIISINSYLKSEGEDSKFFFNKLVKNIGLNKEEISDSKKE